MYIAGQKLAWWCLWASWWVRQLTHHGTRGTAIAVHQKAAVGDAVYFPRARAVFPPVRDHCTCAVDGGVGARLRWHAHSKM